MNLTPKDLLDAGVHLGHQTKRWNPRSKPYIFDWRLGADHEESPPPATSCSMKAQALPSAAWVFSRSMIRDALRCRKCRAWSAGSNAWSGDRGERRIEEVFGVRFMGSMS